MPFCHVNRLTLAKIGPQVSGRPKCRSSTCRWAGGAAARAPNSVLDAGIRGWIPYFQVYAVDDAHDIRMPFVHHAFQPHAEGRGHDFPRIGGADDRDRIGCLQAALEEPDIAVIFDAVDRICFRREAELGEVVGRELPLERKVVHGQDARNGVVAGVLQIEEAHRRVPVMCVNDVRPPVGNEPARDLRCDQREGGEAFPVVRIIPAMPVYVESPLPVIEGRRIEHEEIQPVSPRRDENGAFAEQAFKLGDRGRVAERAHDAGVTRNEAARVDAVGPECLGERSRYTARPPVLTSGKISAVTDSICIVHVPGNVLNATGPLAAYVPSINTIMSIKVPAVR